MKRVMLIIMAFLCLLNLFACDEASNDMGTESNHSTEDNVSQNNDKGNPMDEIKEPTFNESKQPIEQPITLKDLIIGEWWIEDGYDSENYTIIFYPDGTCFVNRHESATWKIVDEHLYLYGDWGGQFYSSGECVDSRIKIEDGILTIDEITKVVKYYKTRNGVYNDEELRRKAIGEWKLISDNHNNSRICLFEDGSCFVNSSESGTWKILNGQFVLYGSYGGRFWSYEERIVGNISFKDGNLVISNYPSDYIYSPS